MPFAAGPMIEKDKKITIAKWHLNQSLIIIKIYTNNNNNIKQGYGMVQKWN